MTAYIILNGTGYIHCGILDKNNCPTVQKTWINFKSHFRKAHHQLWETTSLQQQQQTTFQANTVQEILTELRNELKDNTADDASIQPSVANINAVTNGTSTTLTSLQSDVAMLKDMINHMAAQPPQAQPPHQQPWVPPQNLYYPYPPLYCNQVSDPSSATTDTPNK